jgi:hypothetical protein
MPGPIKITFAELRNMGVRGVLVYCADYRCSHSIAISADRWPDDHRLSDIEDRSRAQPAASVALMLGRLE